MATTLKEPLRTNIDAELKHQAAELYASYGMSLTAAITMFFRQSVIEGGIPFAVSTRASRLIPNDETRRALVEAEARELGIIPDDAARFSDVESAMAWLDSEDD